MTNTSKNDNFLEMNLKGLPITFKTENDALRALIGCISGTCKEGSKRAGKKYKVLTINKQLIFEEDMINALEQSGAVKIHNIS